MNNIPSSARTTIGRLVLLAGLLALLGSCGFQPRGQQFIVTADPGPVIISGLPAYNNFVRTLTRQLEDAGVSLADNRQTARTEIRIYKQKSDRRIMSVDDRRKTVEYEIGETLEYSINQVAAKAAGEKQVLATQRILFNPGTDLLGRNREEVMLRQDMYEDLSRRLIQRLSHSNR